MINKGTNGLYGAVIKTKSILLQQGSSPNIMIKMAKNQMSKFKSNLFFAETIILEQFYFTQLKFYFKFTF